MLGPDVVEPQLRLNISATRIPESRIRIARIVDGAARSVKGPASRTAHDGMCSTDGGS
jgi:hypothetical protein